jgi:hypothetical protein
MEREQDPGAGTTAEPQPVADAGEPVDLPDASPLDVPSIRRLSAPARRALGALVSGAEAAAEPIVDRVSHAIEGAERSWHERPGARVRRVRRLGAQPLAYLMEVHPDARQARPVDVGLRTIDVGDIAGTAVGGGDQRGGDFLPLKPFRGSNWLGRWQRLRAAHERLVDLPPIDVVKYAGRYWVVDGHNRVALALYAGQVGIDADIVELVPPGGRRTEPILSSAPQAAESRALRTAGSGRRPSELLVREGTMEPDAIEGVD